MKNEIEIATLESIGNLTTIMCQMLDTMKDLQYELESQERDISELERNVRILKNQTGVQC